MSKPRILVVEDNLVIQKLVGILAQRNGVDADFAGSSKEALACVNSPDHEYQVIFMDWSLPDASGLDCTREIRKAAAVHIPIVAMTANIMPGDRERCLEAGMDDYISKPFTNEQFMSIVFRWLDASPSA